MTIEIAGLYRYPLKSGAALAETEITALETGFKYDRCAMLIDSNDKFLTQRAIPKLAFMRLKKIDDGRWELRYRDQAIIWEEKFEKTRPATVWNDHLEAYEQGEEIDNFVSQALGKKTRLVLAGPQTERPVNPKRTPRPMQQLFADGYPYLITSTTSLEDLQKRITTGEQIPMNRFRPNIVLSGIEEAFAEDNIDRLKIGDCVFKVTHPCVRCVVTTTDQKTAVRGVEPIKTLASYRNFKEHGGICFGVNAILLDGAGKSVSKDDQVEIISQK